MLYFNTIRRMRPGMILSRLRPQRKVSMRSVGTDHVLRICSLCIPELDLEEGYLSRFDVDALLRDEFLLINERHYVDLKAWNVPDASHLWNFNLHYFEYCIALAAAWRRSSDARYLECFKRLVRTWLRACPYANGDAWHPYTISLRLINWLIAIELFDGRIEEDSGFFSAMRESMYCQYRHLFVNQETLLRANHWWENLKTLVIMSATFGERDVHAKAMRCLEGQLDEQILPDGVHFERSLMYHKLVLEGLLRVYVASRQLHFKFPDSFVIKMKSMLDAMASLERGMGKTPSFNDSADGVAKECNQLVVACGHLLGMEADDSKTAFPDAGYYKLYNGGIAVMLDAGEPGPSYMLGHAHCDCLSFELSYGGEPLIVNSGTYAYQSELRPYFRSAAAHNTCVVDGEEQLECWGEHRVARSYRDAKVEELGASRAVVSMTMRSGARIQREVSLDRNGCTVSDRVISARRRISIESPFHVVSSADNARISSVSAVCEDRCPYSREFGLLGDAKVFKVSGDDAVMTRIEVGEGYE